MSIVKFKFHLEPVLKQRAEKEVAAEQELALACNEYNQRLNLLENSRRQLEITLEASKSSKLDFFEIRQLSLYQTSLEEIIKDQEDNVHKAGLNVKHKRDGVVQAKQEREALEKLKEQHLQNYRRKMAEREQKEVDELSLNAYQRRSKQLQPQLI